MAEFARHCDVSAHHLTKPLADREPEASAAVFASRGCVGLREFLEQLTHLVRRDPNAGVSNRDGRLGPHLEISHSEQLHTASRRTEPH